MNNDHSDFLLEVIEDFVEPATRRLRLKEERFWTFRERAKMFIEDGKVTVVRSEGNH